MSVFFCELFQDSLKSIIKEPVSSIAVYGFSDWYGVLENKLRHLGFDTLNWKNFSFESRKLIDNHMEIEYIEKVCKISLILIVKNNIALASSGKSVNPVLFVLQDETNKYPKIHLDTYKPKLITVSEIKMIRKLMYDPFLPELFKETALKTFKFVSVDLQKGIIRSIKEINYPWTRTDLPLKNPGKLWRQLALDFPLKKISKASAATIVERKRSCCVIS